MNQVVDVNTDGRPRRYSKHSDLMTLGMGLPECWCDSPEPWKLNGKW